MTKTVIYPGSFDPITNGHVDIIERSLNLFDKVIVAILTNPGKKFLFTIEERIDLIRESMKGKNIEVDHYDGLLVNYAQKKKVKVVIRGMRAVSDFDNDFYMALMNRRLCREIQTVFLMTGLRWIFISSSGIKEVASLGGDIHGMVPSIVEKKLKEKFNLK